MWLVRLALKLGMILAGEEIGVIAQLDQFRQRTIGGRSRDRKAFLGHPVAIFHVEFVTMAVSLDHVSLAVDLFGKRALHDFCRPRAQSHACAFIAHTTLLLEQRDDWFPGVLVELGAVCVLNAADISRKLKEPPRHL